jgi:hypothetical protein
VAKPRPFRDCLLIWHHRSGPYRGSWDPAPVLGSRAMFKKPMARKILLKNACAVQNLFRTFAKLLMRPRFTSYHRFHLVPKGNRDELTNQSFHNQQRVAALKSSPAAKGSSLPRLRACTGQAAGVAGAAARHTALRRLLTDGVTSVLDGKQRPMALARPPGRGGGKTCAASICASAQHLTGRVGHLTTGHSGEGRWEPVHGIPRGS